MGITDKTRNNSNKNLTPNKKLMLPAVASASYGSSEAAAAVADPAYPSEAGSAVHLLLVADWLTIHMCVYMVKIGKACVWQGRAQQSVT